MGAKTVLARRCQDAAREIEETRRRIGDRAEVLQGRFKPRALLRPLTKRLRGTLGEGGEKILDSFRDNPIPLTLTGLGLAWLILKDLRGGPRGEGEAAEKTKEAGHKVREAAAAVPGKVRHGVEKASDWFSSTLDENPLILGVAVLALGALAGLSFPASRKEEETLGKAGEKAAEAALEKGTAAVEKSEPPAESVSAPGAREAERLAIPPSEEAPD